MIDHLLACRILVSATAIYFFVKTWKLCKHKGLLFLAAQACMVVFVQFLIASTLIKPDTFAYGATLMVVCLFGAVGAYLIYSEFNKAYQEGRYALETSP